MVAIHGASLAPDKAPTNLRPFENDMKLGAYWPKLAERIGSDPTQICELRCAC